MLPTCRLDLSYLVEFLFDLGSGLLLLTSVFFSLASFGFDLCVFVSLSWMLMRSRSIRRKREEKKELKRSLDTRYDVFLF